MRLRVFALQDSIRICTVIDPKQNLNAGTSYGQNVRPFVRLLMKSCLLAVCVAFVQASFVGGQVQAQPIFRTPLSASPSQQSGLQLTSPTDSKMAPIRNVAPVRNVVLGEFSPSPFQLPQTEQTGGFFTPTPAAQSQSDSIRGQELREVGENGSFLPVDDDSSFEPNQDEAIIDMPGIDLSALGLDVRDPSDVRGRGSGSGSRDLERLPSSLGELDVPRRRPDNVHREQVIENYPDGQPRLLRTVALDREGNYYNDGPWVVKDREGKVVAAGAYRKGVMHGQWARRHTPAEGGMFTEKPFTLFQGPYDSMASFKAGKLDGQWIVYDRAHRSIFEIGYKDGIRDGLATWFYPDTTKMRQATFKEGVLDGEVVEWDEDGRLVSKEFYREGRKLIRNTSFYRPKVPKEESYYLDVKLKQNGLDNWWEAKPAPYLASGERVQNGQARGWYSNQQLQYQGQFRNNEPVGRFFWWHENGNRSTVGQFDRAGDRSGRWIWWHENGLKKIEGNYKDDQPSGVWRSWDKAGKLIKNKDYDNLPAQQEDQINPLDGFSALEKDSDEGALEGMLEIESDDQAPEGEAGPAIGAGLIDEDEDEIEEGGLLPLPEDESSVEPGENPAGSLQPLDEERFESLPPPMVVEEDEPKVEYVDEASVTRNVGVIRERDQVDPEAWGRRFGDEEVATEGATSVVEETTVIENGEIDDAAEAFDLGDLFD